MYDDVKPGTIVDVDIYEVLAAVVPSAAAVDIDMRHETW